MSDDKKLVSSIEEQIARISNNFESDVLRLIKTQSMIKSSEEIINDEVDFLKTNIELIGNKLDEISIKTSEINELLKLSSEYKNHSSTHIERYLNDYLNLLTTNNNELSALKNHLEERLSSGSASLKSLQKYYIAELKAFQQEVDTNLEFFREQLEEKIESQLSNNNRKNEAESDEKVSDLPKNENGKKEIVDLEMVEEVPAGNNGKGETEPFKTPREKPSDEIDSKKKETTDTVKGKPVNEKTRIERERLENEFRNYKESFKKQTVQKPHLKRTMKADEYYQKMFASSVVRKKQKLSADIRKYIIVSVLIVWVIAVFGFYLLLLKKDDVKNVNTANYINEPVITEDYSNNQFMLSNNGFNDNTADSNLIKPFGSSTSESVEVPLDEPDEMDEYAENSVPLYGSETEDKELSYEQEVASAPVYDYTVIVKKANIRKGPGKRYGIVSTLTFGQQVHSLDQVNGIWLKVKSEEGDEGWIARRLILKN